MLWLQWCFLLVVGVTVVNHNYCVFDWLSWKRTCVYRTRQAGYRERGQAAISHLQVPQSQQRSTQRSQQPCGRGQSGQRKLRPPCYQVGTPGLSQGEGLYAGSSQSTFASPRLCLLFFREVWGNFSQDGEETATPAPSQTRQVPHEELVRRGRGQSGGGSVWGAPGLSGTEWYQRAYTEVSSLPVTLGVDYIYIHIYTTVGRVCVSVTFWQWVIFGLCFFVQCTVTFLCRKCS